MYSKSIAIAILAIFLVALFWNNETVHGVLATKTWDGGGTTNNWSDGANWSGDTVPGARDIIVFDGSSIRDASVDVDVNAVSINISSSYTGTISVNNGVNVTFSGNGGVASSQAGGTFTNSSGTITFGFTFLMSGGVFNNGSGTVIFDRDLNQTGGIFNDLAVANTGNINFSQFSSLLINGGIFNAPQGNLTLARDLKTTSGTFNHNNGTVVFSDGLFSSIVEIGPGEIIFNNLTISKLNEHSVFLTQISRIVRITGTLELSAGALAGNTDSVFRAEGPVNISSAFGEHSNFSGANSGVLQIKNGPVGRVISIPAGTAMPNVVIDDPGVTINGINPGLILTGKLSLNRGVVNFGSTDVTAGVGPGASTCVDQTGGSISIGSGNFRCEGSFLLSQPDNANPSSFTAGTGNFVLDEPGSVFRISGGTFNAPLGTTIINTGEFNNDYTQSGGTFNSSGPFDCQCAQFVLSGGTFNATAGTSIFRRVFVRTGGTFNPNGGTTVLTSAPGGGMVGPTVTTFHNLTVAYSGNNHQLFAATTGTLLLQSGIVDGGGSVDAKSAVQIESGFGGSTVAVTFSGSGTQTYTNAGGLNPTGQWTINKPSGALNLNSDLDISNGVASFNLTSGIINTGSNVVSLGTRSISGGNNASYVNGKLRRTFPAAGSVSYKFDVGTAAGHAPVTILSPSRAAATPLTVSSVGAPHPLFDPAGSLSLYWQVGEGAGLTNTSLTFVYPQAAVNGNEVDYRVDRVENGQIQIFQNPITITTNTVTLTGIDISTADWTMSEVPPPLVLTGPNPVNANPGEQIHYAASGGRPPYTFSIPVNNSGATLSSGPSSTFYTAGPTQGMTDTLRLTDSLGTTQDALITVVNPFVVVNTNGSGAGSLERAIENSDDAPGTQTITFNIPGPPPYVITTDHTLNISDTVIIDGFTQPGSGGSPIVQVRNSRLQLFASNSTIKGLVINGNTAGFGLRCGILIGGNASGNVIQGNYIGTDVTGNAALGNDIGIQIQNADNNVIGGTLPAQRNVIAGNLRSGIDLSGLGNAVANNVIKGNYIGVGADGVTPLGNGEHGITFDGAQNNVIGGIAANEGNVIANNVGAGISTSNFSPAQSFGNSIRGNSIFANGGLGIDIRPSGVNANDPCDADTGINRAQNFPELTSVVSFAGNTVIEGTLYGEPNKTYSLDFYRNTSSQTDDSGFGEGGVYIGSGQVTTPATCTAPTSFSVTLPLTTNTDQVVTATATDPEGNTSEFSRFLGIQPADLSGTILNSNNSPLKGAAVTLRRPGSPRALQTASTDKAGRFKFANVVVGTDYEVVPRFPNFVFTPASRTYKTVTTSHDDPYTAVVNNFSIGGHLTMAGFSLGGAKITLSGAADATTTTDSNGDYIFNNLRSGTYTVTPTKQDVVFAPSSVNLPTIASDQTANFDGMSLLSTLPGRIVFSDGGNIKAMNPDGSGRVTVLHYNTVSGFFSPRVSRAGDKMVLSSTFNNGSSITTGRVRTSRVDGSFLSPLLFGGNGCDGPTFSPNADQISCVHNELVSNVSTFPITRFNADGSGTSENLTPLNTTFNRKPDWGPDGSKIVYSSQLNSIVTSISAVNVVTHAQTDVRLEGHTHSTKPRWSPDGSKIVFDRLQPTLDSIAVVNADGSDFHVIATATPPNFVTNPVWSPDGTRIAFVRHFVGGATELVTTLPDGSDLIVIDPAFNNNEFDWASDNNVATPAGANTQVQSGRVTINFPATSGVNKLTTITPIDPAAAGNTPGGFVVDGFAYEISTTANFVPPAVVCISLNSLVDLTEQQFNAYTFMHNEGGVMVDRTVTPRDFASRKICGSLPSFSPVALMKQVDPAMPTISGLVVDRNGDPINDVAVLISDDDVPVKTNHLGQFEFVNLKVGADYKVQAFKAGHMFAPPYQTFLNLSGDQTVVFTATAANFDISGSVVDGANNPLADVNVRLNGSTEAETVTAADGTFIFNDLPANGTFTVAPLPTANPFTPNELTIGELQSDLTGLVFQQFAPTAAEVSITGRVLSAKGRGIRGARLTLISPDGSRQAAITSSFGYYAFDGVEVGHTYVLEIASKRYIFANATRIFSLQDALTDVDFIAEPQ